MRFSKQIKSLERRFAPLRQRSPLVNKVYNHLLGINIQNTFHSRHKKERIINQAQDALHALMLPTESNQITDDIPKVIWMYWDSGFENAPSVVKLSVQSWQKLNPDYEVKLLSDESLSNVLGFDFQAMFQLSTVHCLPAIKADLLRLHLLSCHGGIWADATTFCLKPLSSWLDGAKKHCGIFTFKHKFNPTRPLEVWFIAAPKNSATINNTLHHLISYIFSKRTYSLYLSGKQSLLKKTHTGSEIAQGRAAMVNGEKLGFMPYFSTGYSLYDAMIEIDKNDISSYLSNDAPDAPHNKYALTKEPMAVYEQALVSKQTYTSSYLKSELYKKRCLFLSYLLKKFTS